MRLTKEVRKGDLEIYVELGRDLRVNDTLALAATSYNADGGETVLV